MDNKPILVTRSSMPPLGEYMDEISDLWESHWLTNRGVKHGELESALAGYFGCDNVSLFTNGHAALECVIESMGLEGEVVTTPFTFASTTHALVRKGLVPVFADIDPNDYTLDPASIEAAITDRTCAIVPVHVYGSLCDVEAIQEIADRHGLKVIYDAAHAFGVTRDGISAACFGDASMFSFHATKVFNTIEGGAVAFRDRSLGDAMNAWKNFGISSDGRVLYSGGNGKMNEFCAAMGLCNLRHVDGEIEKRSRVAARYDELLAPLSSLRRLRPQAGVEPNYAYYPIVVGDDFPLSRDELSSSLKNEGICARKYFYPLTSDFECYRGRFGSPEDTPIAEDISRRVLTLPIYADLRLEDVDRICGIILTAARERG